ncbi:hypothetical protein IC582_003446 [Cucumis melo]
MQIYAPRLVDSSRGIISVTQCLMVLAGRVSTNLLEWSTSMKETGFSHYDFGFGHPRLFLKKIKKIKCLSLSA